MQQFEIQSKFDSLIKARDDNAYYSYHNYHKFANLKKIKNGRQKHEFNFRDEPVMQYVERTIELDPITTINDTYPFIQGNKHSLEMKVIANGLPFETYAYIKLYNKDTSRTVVINSTNKTINVNGTTITLAEATYATITTFLAELNTKIQVSFANMTVTLESTGKYKFTNSEDLSYYLDFRTSANNTMYHILGFAQEKYTSESNIINGVNRGDFYDMVSSYAYLFDEVYMSKATTTLSNKLGPEIIHYYNYMDLNSEIQSELYDLRGLQTLYDTYNKIHCLETKEIVVKFPTFLDKSYIFTNLISKLQLNVKLNKNIVVLGGSESNIQVKDFKILMKYLEIPNIEVEQIVKQPSISYRFLPINYQRYTFQTMTSQTVKEQSLTDNPYDIAMMMVFLTDESATIGNKLKMYNIYSSEVCNSSGTNVENNIIKIQKRNLNDVCRWFPDIPYLKTHYQKIFIHSFCGNPKATLLNNMVTGCDTQKGENYKLNISSADDISTPVSLNVFFFHYGIVKVQQNGQIDIFPKN